MSQDGQQPLKPAVSVCNLCKSYVSTESPATHLLDSLATLRHLLLGKPTSQSTAFHALEDVSFELPKGRSLGVIGLNGSGKSTLLQIVAGTLIPTAGEVRMNGRLAALLELGSGFNSDFTGRENVRLNANLLGLTRKETEKRLDDILAFADIGDFASLPVRTYSSGMLMRLAFAVVAHVDPDILLVDEALAVGDFLFQLKCLRAMKNLQEKGCSFLLVSHSMEMIMEFCDEVLYLEQGKAKYCGPVKDGVELYEKYALEAHYETRLATSDSEEADVSDTEFESPNLETKYARPLACRMLDDKHQPRDLFRTGETIQIEIDVLFNSPCQDPHCGFKLKDSSGRIAFGANTYGLGKKHGPVETGTSLTFAFSIDQQLTPGKYTINFGLVSEGFGFPRTNFEKVLFYKHDAIVFTILRQRDQGDWSGPTLMNVKASCCQTV